MVLRIQRALAVGVSSKQVSKKIQSLLGLLLNHSFVISKESFGVTLKPIKNKAKTFSLC
jgi:hypothetical protein